MSGQPAQTKTIRSQLLADMKDGAYASCERLPRESVLAEKMGISRTQLRDILASLEREGFIYSVPGKGSFASDRRPEDPARREELIARLRELVAELRYLGVADRDILALMGEGSGQ